MLSSLFSLTKIKITMQLSFKNLCRVLLISIITINISFAQKKVKSNNAPLKEISGIITTENYPLANVNITIKKSKKGTKTNTKGFFSIKAKEGDVIKFSYLGLQKLEIIVNDVTKVLNIDMRVITNELEEVVIDRVVKMPTAYGEINPNMGSRSYIKGEDLNQGAIDLFSAIRYRIPSMRSLNSITLSNAVIWDIDGIVYKNNPPPIDVSQVVDIAVLRSLADLTFYGGVGRNGVIVVRTKTAYFDDRDPYSVENPYTNKVLYKGDAKSLTKLDFSNPKYISDLGTEITNFQAFEKFQELAINYNNKLEYYLEFSKYFSVIHSDLSSSLKVLAAAEITFAKNPEELKAIAYIYQDQGLNKLAVNTYKKIIKLRPKHAQSFRDLANAYVEDKEFKNAWKIYMNYLYRGNKLDEKGIGITIYNEMESLFTQKKDVSNIREAFITKDEKSFKKDIRIVFEWNTSEAEFVFEFVNPQKQSYTFEHSFYANKNIIIDEKTKGYASMEFFIEELSKGNWLTNVTYLGNKTDATTYLKATIYYNWGKAKQTKEVKVIKLVHKNEKIQLLKLNAKMPSFVSSR